MTTTAVVIGAASGIGAAVARRLAADDTRLLLADIHVAALDSVAAGLPGDVQTHGCDIADRASLESLADAMGPFRTLVLTAGLSPTMAPGRRIHRVDIIGPADLIDLAAPLAGPGSVAVLVASMAGHMIPPDDSIDAVLDRPLAHDYLEQLDALGMDSDDPSIAYALSKRAVLRLVRREAGAWGDRGARLLSVSPGVVDTPMGAQEHEQQPVMADMVASSALGRMIQPDEIAAVIEFAASDAASALTGTDLLVDGGVVAAMGS